MLQQRHYIISPANLHPLYKISSIDKCIVYRIIINSLYKSEV